MAKRPPASSLSEKVTVPPLTSLEVAVIPTRSPLAAPSETVLVASLPSVGCEGATSVTAIVKVWAGERAAGVGRLDGDVVAGRRLVVEQRGIGHGHDAGRGIDGEAAAGVVAQREGDGAAVDVARGRGDPDQVAVGGAFRNRVGGMLPSVGCDGATSVTAIVKVSAGERAAGVGRLDGDVVAGRRLVVEQRGIGHGHDAGRGIDGEAAAGVVAQREGDGAAVDVARGRGDPDQVAVGGAFRNRVGGSVAVGRLRGRNVGDRDREGLGGERAAGVGRHGR